VPLGGVLAPNINSMPLGRVSALKSTSHLLMQSSTLKINKPLGGVPAPKINNMPLGRVSAPRIYVMPLGGKFSFHKNR